VLIANCASSLSFSWWPFTATFGGVPWEPYLNVRGKNLIMFLKRPLIAIRQGSMPTACRSRADLVGTKDCARKFVYLGFSLSWTRCLLLQPVHRDYYPKHLLAVPVRDIAMTDSPMRVMADRDRFPWRSKYPQPYVSFSFHLQLYFGILTTVGWDAVERFCQPADMLRPRRATSRTYFKFAATSCLAYPI